MGPQFTDVPRMVVGIVGNVRELGLQTDAPPTMFVPAGQVPDTYTQLVNRFVPLSWVIKTDSDPGKLINTVRHEVLSMNIQQPVTNFRPLNDILTKTLARQHFNMLLLSIFAVIALTLSAVGLYSLMSYSVTERTHEISIRIALGAQPRNLLLLIISNAMKLILIGLIIGLGAAFALTRLLSSLLFEVKATDPITFLTVSLLLILIATLASYIPARRASRIDPIVNLRHQ
jgi:putative ABC transport system permease protein